jgi:hypothetical protein
MNEPRVEAADRVLDAVAQAMTAHPAPDVASAVRARLGRRTSPALRPTWAAAALSAVVVVAVGMWLAPGRPTPESPPTTVASGPRLPAAPAAAVEPPQVRPAIPARAPALPASRLSPPPPPLAPVEPWPGDELREMPLRVTPLAAPPLAIDGIGLAPLSAPEPLGLEAMDLPGHGEEE